jgi:transcriptional regulator with XRE-family HTH domain
MGTFHVMKLIEYLREQNLTDEQFAEQVGKSKWAVRKWMYGQRVPRHNEMQSIALLTGGKVTANDFFGDPPPFPAPGGAADPDAGEAA